TGDYAPDGVELNYGTFGDVFTNNVNTAFTSQLTGLGSNKGKDMGVSSDLVNSGRMQLDLASREPIGGGVSLGSFSRLAMNSDQLLMTFATLTGTGINATNNQAVLGAADSSLYLLLQTGKPVAPLGGGLLLNLPEMAASNDIPRVAFICNLRQGPASGAVPKVDASNDSGLLNYYFSTDADAVREGSQASPSLDTTRLGQLAPRLALASIRHFYSAALTPPASGPDTLTITPTNNTALFRRLTASEADVVAVKGDSVKDAGENIVPAIHYAAFIGEASGGDDHLVYRATMASTTPGAVTTATNEALWAFTKNNDNRMVLRKGQSLAPFLPGLTVAGIINYWATAYQDGTEQAIALVKLGGPGVTAANDQALLLWQTTGTLLLLMREGDAAPGCPGAKIGVITRVEVDNVYGNYAILATLTGATPTSDLALFTGIDNLYNNAAEQAPLRRPVLRLRKGQLFDNQPGHVRSISLPTTNLTASGAGGTGRGHALSSFSNLAIVVEFDNGVRQVMKGRAN
ncbi:MAG: hypothetical protein JWO94_2636, partial [Verrucomicrobiaceae bacterium]|nr:hypothetical protein [Verrucomicrobiaceae bacterium]